MTTTSDIPPLPPLSVATLTAWAKSRVDPTQGLDPVEWLPLHAHLADTAEVAGRLWDHRLPQASKRLITERTGGDEASTRALVVWLAACHDVGKISPAFAVQVSRLADDMSSLGLHSDPALAGTEERRKVRHELVSHLAVVQWLRQEQSFPAKQAKRLASVLAAHHGLPPNDGAVQSAAAQTRLVGDDAWDAARAEILHWTTTTYATEHDVEVWRTAELPQHVLVLLSAIVIVADWIASSDLFPLCPLGEQPAEDAATRARRAWASLSLPAPWQARPPASDDELFTTRFNLPGARPRPVQAAMMQLARGVESPPLIIVEAEMGVGKTEAALTAAEILTERFDLGGIFVGLPTQATADGIFERVLEWADRLDLDAPNNVFLARGKSQLNERYAALTWDAYLRSTGRQHNRRHNLDDDLVIAHRWFGDPKRGPLANLVVGTIDQALFGALRSKHLMLRHLALAGKVVILDEVHAYDAYMGQYLERVLHWLGAYRVPVIMLSATLPSERRRAFVSAYDEGARSGAATSALGNDAAEVKARYASLDGDIGYPSIVVSRGAGTPMILRPEPTGGSRTVALERIGDGDEDLVALLRAALREGGNAVVIRNTVRRVQATASALRAAFPETTVTVAHSRYIGLDRARKDRDLIASYGPKGTRPRTSIVVASQVVEQSLDLDFDLMVSDLAPIDLLLQRSGRLHRHQRAHRPAPLSTPRLVITGADWSTEPPTADAGSEHVYSPYVLLRTLAALDGRKTIVVPDDIPALVQVVYGNEPLGPRAWAPALSEAKLRFDAKQADKRAAAHDFLQRPVQHGGDAHLLGWVHAGAGDPAGESRAQATVRDGEETLEVLLLQQEGELLHTPDWLPNNGGVQIPDNELPSRDLTNTILGCALRLPAAMCKGGLIDTHIAWLERSFILPIWHRSPALKGELVLTVDAAGHGRLDPFTLRYSPEDGLEYARESELPS